MKMKMKNVVFFNDTFVKRSVEFREFRIIDYKKKNKLHRFVVVVFENVLQVF